MSDENCITAPLPAGASFSDLTETAQERGALIKAGTLERKTSSPTTYPIGEAPAGDGWILGLVASDGAPLAASSPWAILTRCDNGWEDEQGYVRSPTAWVPLPDPQPSPTGWRPAEGVVSVGAAKGLNWDWKGWIVHVELPDGSHDGFRDPDYLDDPKKALAVASEWSARLNLPVEVGSMVHDDSNVVQFRPRGTTQ